MSSSNFYLPLTGKEGTERLEGKYKDLLDSDDDDDDDDDDSQRSRGRGKISEWTLDDSTTDNATTSRWLHSPSKKNAHCRLNVIKKCQTPKNMPRRNLKSASTKYKSSASKPINIDCEKEVTVQQLDRQRKRYSSHSAGDEDIDELESDDDKPSKKLSKGCFDNKEKAKALGSSFAKGSEGFSTVDTERPKLSVRPVAAKIDFQLSLDGDEPIIKVPACINQYLRDYQRDGIRFLYQHYIQDKGAILGDDMGLGKTIQVIGFLSALLGKQGNNKDSIRALPKFIRQLSDEESDSPPRAATKPFIIIAPSAVMYNWLEELNTWGYFCTGKFHGTDKDNCLADVKKGKLEIVVTTFETFRDNVDRLCEIEWEAVIVDEVHKIKGLKAQVSKALGRISTLCRFGLTGTALQNNMIELWSILDWAQPGILGSPEKFSSKFIDAIEMGQRHDATKRDLALARKKKDKFAEIRNKIMLRRTKAILADQLPSKEDSVVMCRLTDFQLCVYKAILNHPKMIHVLQAEDRCDCGKKKLKASCCYRYAEDGTKTWSLVLSYMHLLLKVANHCALLIPHSKMSDRQIQHVQEVSQQALKDFPQFVEQTRDAAFLTLSDPKYCGKMKILQGLLSVFASAHDKVLVFSYSTRLLDIIEHYIISQCFEYRRIDGKTSSQKRMDIVHQFNKDRDIFLCLISTKAGGLGLNLTGANKVVIFDPNWNPSHDLQAQDRAYRIGQTRDVKVYRLVSAGTIEENIYLRQIYKQQLDEVAIATSNAKRYFHGVQGDKWSRGELFGVKNMFTLRTSNTCLTMDILKRNERLEKDLAGYDITRYIPPVTESDSVDCSNDESDNNEDDDDMDEKEEEKEEDSFLQMFFGQDIAGNEGNRSPMSVTKKTANLQDDGVPSTSKNYDKSDGGSSDNEDFFLPKIHSKSKDETKKRKSDQFTVDKNKIPFTKSAFYTEDVGENDVDDQGEEKEDSNIFPQRRFGQGRSADDENRSSPMSLKKKTANLKDNAVPSTSKNNDESDVGSNDEEDFFLPKIHSISNDETRMDLSEKTTKSNQFTVDEITFSKSAFLTVQTTQPKLEKIGEKKNILKSDNGSSGLSWLLSESENDEDDKQDTTRAMSYLKRRINPKVFLKQRKTPSTLSLLFPDSDDDDDNNRENDVAHLDDEESDGRAENEPPSTSCVKSKYHEETTGKEKRKKPSTQHVKQTKTRRVNSSRQTGSGKSDFDSVKAVFEECGVLHVHGNKDVIGSSRAEDHMTRCAMKEVYEKKTNTQLPALQCDPLPQTVEAEEEPKSKKRKGKKEPPDHNMATSTKFGSVKILLGQTPPGVQRQAWNELCKHLGEDQLALAQRIAKCEPEERLEMLREFYTKKHPQLTDILAVMLCIKSPGKPCIGKEVEKGKQQPEKSEPSRKGSSSEQHFSKKNNTKDNTSRPPKRSKGKQRRPPACTLTDHTLLNSDSQDSLTAHSPPIDPSLSQDKDSEGFSPVASKRKQKLVSLAGKISATTRIRQKALNKIARAKLFEKPPERKGIVYSSDQGRQNDMDDECESVQVCDRLVTPVTESNEDIPSLLYEMGRRTSVQQGENHSFTSVLYCDKQKSPSKYTGNVTDNCLGATGSIVRPADTESYNISAMPSHSTQIKDKKQANLRRTYVSILDDLFDETPDVDSGGFIKARDKVQNVPLSRREINTEQSHSPSKRTRVEFGDDNEEPSTSSRIPQNDKNSSCEESVMIIDDSDNYDEVDCLLMTSTLKEDIPKSSKRKEHHTNHSGRRGNARKAIFPMQGQEEVMDEARNSHSLF